MRRRVLFSALFLLQAAGAYLMAGAACDSSSDSGGSAAGTSSAGGGSSTTTTSSSSSSSATSGAGGCGGMEACQQGSGGAGQGGGMGGGAAQGGGGSDCVPVEHDPSCPLAFSGDPAMPLEMEIVALDGTGQNIPLDEGAGAPLILPPQGGRVILAGVRARNFDPCGVTLSGVIRDEQSHKVQLDFRTVNLLPAEDGWSESSTDDINRYANIPVCPNQWSDVDLYGKEYELTIMLSDLGCRSATKTIHVVPYCAEPAFEAECMCMCKAGYMLGESCN